ncbi:Obg family GTPase CgtA [Nannocystaceae bacterium ST9]
MVYYEGEVEEQGDPRPWEVDEDAELDEIPVDEVQWNPDDPDVFDSPNASPDTDEPIDDDESELENVWVADPSPEPSEAELDRDPMLEGAPPEIRESISSSAQRQHMAEHPREAPRRSPRRERGQLIGDLDHPGAQLLIAHGGRGGRGNVHFVSATNRSPDRAEPGTPGEAMWLRLELKLLADVGIVGYPNVGKSTLISRISRARPEIADYPFTTLAPNLGVVSLSGERTMVVADVPGLIDGASEGRGLGHEFLRHLERTRVLLHLLAPDPTPGREVLADLDALEGELRRYGDMFEGRPRVVALNKLDTPESQALVKRARRMLRKRNIPLFAISAVTGEGVDALLEALWRRLDLVRKREAEARSRSSDEGSDLGQ